ncbi:MAG: VOC family protein [Acidobacteria bacterium]|nr:VOC family protein [Acidobacteriota bacterium]
MSPAHSVSFVEIGSCDAATSGAFLMQLLRWPFHPMSNGGDGWFQTPTMKVGLHGNDPTPGFTVFFGVENLDESMGEVVRLGGTAGAPTDEPGFGRFCMCIDPSGLKFGLHQRPAND